MVNGCFIRCGAWRAGASLSREEAREEVREAAPQTGGRRVFGGDDLQQIAEEERQKRLPKRIERPKAPDGRGSDVPERRKSDSAA